MRSTRYSSNQTTAQQPNGALDERPASAASPANMAARQKKSTKKRKAKTPLAKKVVQRARPAQQAESEQSDIEIEISNGSPDNTQVSLFAEHDHKHGLATDLRIVLRKSRSAQQIAMYIDT